MKLRKKLTGSNAFRKCFEGAGEAGEIVFEEQEKQVAEEEEQVFTGWCGCLTHPYTPKYSRTIKGLWYKRSSLDQNVHLLSMS